MEYRRKCTVCGKIYCYTDADLSNNRLNSASAAISALGAVASLIGGTRLDTYALNSQTERYNSKVVDFNQCPNCHSISTVPISEEEWTELQNQSGASADGTVIRTIEVNSNATVESLLKRAHLFLEDAEWGTADAYCEKVLDVEPENAEAYVGKLMAELHIHSFSELQTCDKPIEESVNYQKAVRFADNELSSELKRCVLERIYQAGISAKAEASNEKDYKAAADILKQVTDFRNAGALIEQCLREAENAHKDEVYQSALSLLENGQVADYEKAISLFATIPEWMDSQAQIHRCNQKIRELRDAESAAEKRHKEQAARNRKIGIVAVTVAVFAAIIGIVSTQIIIPANQYKEAEALLVAGDYDGAILAFSNLGDYSDSQERVLQARYAKADILLVNKEYDNAIEIFTALGDYSDAEERAINIPYIHAEDVLADGDFDDAIAAFEALGEYKDAVERANQIREIKNQEKYAYAESLLQTGNKSGAAIAFGQIAEYKDARARSLSLWDEFVSYASVSAGCTHTLGLKEDGSIIATEYRGNFYHGKCDVLSWKDIVSISAGASHSVGLKSDGTVTATKYTGDIGYSGQCDVSGWRDIVAISAGDYNTFGLKLDGTVVTTESEDYDVSDWSDIIAISAGGSHIVGLRSDGTVIAVGDNNHRQCDVADWTNIIKISAGRYHTVGLKLDGTVVATGRRDNGVCDVSHWTDIVEISSGAWHTVGLKSDGTVIATGWNRDGQCAVANWSDIIAISAGEAYTIGLKSDGTVVATTFNNPNDYSGQCDVWDWVNIRKPEFMPH